MRRRFDVEVEPDVVDGVAVQIITPGDGVPKRNARRVLINLHGGAFTWGGGDGGLVESIPVAVGRFKVVAVDYRLGPEHCFPAASVDVAAVYANLLGDYDAASVGIYGCSAGGVLTAQAIAWFDHIGLPMPGAIGMLCGSGLEFDGDSSRLGPPLSGEPAISIDNPPVKLRSLPYLRDTSADDALVFPLGCDEMVRKFPPALLIGGGRDVAASSLTVAHRRLSAAGCDSRLFLFDGLWHAFFTDPDLPESSETYALISRFFADRLLA